MKKRIILIIGVCFFISTALVGGADESKKKTVNRDNRLSIPLKGSQFNAGAIGNAAFVATDETISEVVIIMGGISKFIMRPVRINTYIYPGSCENLGEAPAYELNDINISYNRGGNTWEATRRIPVALSSLLENDYALVIRSSAPDGNRDLFCGDIR
jgi:hypothetical protein